MTQTEDRQKRIELLFKKAMQLYNDHFAPMQIRGSLNDVLCNAGLSANSRRDYINVVMSKLQLGVKLAKEVGKKGRGKRSKHATK